MFAHLERNPWSSWSYRYPGDPLPAELRPYYDLSANCTMLCMWGWMFWHLFTEPGHLTVIPHKNICFILYFKFFFTYFQGPGVPDPTKWTDEELGIPQE